MSEEDLADWLDRHADVYAAQLGLGHEILGGHARVRSAKAGGRGTADFVGHRHRDVMGAAMEVHPARQITCSEISDGVPPIFAQYVAEQLLDHLADAAPKRRPAEARAHTQAA